MFVFALIYKKIVTNKLCIPNTVLKQKRIKLLKLNVTAHKKRRHLKLLGKYVQNSLRVRTNKQGDY